MKIELNNLSETRKTLVVSLDQSEVDGEYQAVLAEFSKMARIPGFRPGKAPAAIVQKRFGKEMAEEFKQKVMGRAYRGGLDETKLDVITIVKVEEGKIEPGQPAGITFAVDVRPQFKLPEYAGLPTEVAPTEVPEAEVDAVIEGLRRERAEFKAAARAAHTGDYVKLAYEGRIDGKPVKELLEADKALYGEMPQTWEEVGGSQGLLPGLGDQLAGLASGDKKDVTIVFPAEFSAAPALAGKTAVYSVTVQEVHERVLPPLDEAFCKGQSVATLDELKTRVRDNLKFRKEQENRAAQRRQVGAALSAKVELTVPDSLVDNETQTVLRQFIEENMRRGVPKEEFEKNKKELYDNARKSATARVKLQLILTEIAKAEKIEVGERDIDNFLMREAMRAQTRPEKLAKELGKDRERLRAVQQSILFDKALDFLVARATVTTVTPKA